MQLPRAGTRPGRGWQPHRHTELWSPQPGDLAPPARPLPQCTASAGSFCKATALPSKAAASHMSPRGTRELAGATEDRKSR